MVRRAASSLVLGALVAFASLGGADAHADSFALPWVETGAPLPKWVASARVLKADQALLSAPFATATRRGSALKDVALPVFATRRAEGCAGPWLEVGPAAWVCDEAVELSGKPAVDALARSVPDKADGLPFRYFFIGPDGSLGYRRLEARRRQRSRHQLEPGFAVAVVEDRLLDGVRYGRTNSGLWIPLRDLGPAHSALFQGAEVPSNVSAIPTAWVIADWARVYRKASALASTPTPTAETKLRFEAVPFLEEIATFAGKLTRVGDGAWIASADLRHPVLSEPPSEVNADLGEKWIDVDLSTQTLVAYEGRRPVFATLVSSGKGKGNAYNATPVGISRVWVKLLSANMDNLEDENAQRYYRMEDVPWVQYFSKGVGLHGAYWHRSFGRVRSHGCVNLAPLDAQRLFWWTSPHLPAGWSAVLPTSHELGTVVRVR